MRKRLRGGALAGIFTLGAGLLLAPAAVADTQSSQGCPAEQWYEVTEVGGPRYESIGSPAGKRNASSTSATLRYDMTTTTARASSWHGSGGLSFDWGIVKIEGETGHDVTKTTSTGKTVSNTLNVPGHYYGYTTPKVERRHFDIDKYEETPACKPRHLAKSGWSDAITAYPFFSECVGTSACTPKP